MPIRASRPSSSTRSSVAKRRADGALGVVLVGERDAEGGHDGVACELLDRAAVRDDAVRDLVEEAVDAPPDDLRVASRRASSVEATRSTKSTVASLRSMPQW